MLNKTIVPFLSLDNLYIILYILVMGRKEPLKAVFFETESEFRRLQK